MMRIGFSTNSLGDVDPFDAVPALRAIGYQSLAITLDRTVLNPFVMGLEDEVARWRSTLDAQGMARVIETGARHLLDPRRKHEPTLVSADPSARGRRVEFLLEAIDIAARLEAGCVSLWSGAVHDAADSESIWQRLEKSLGPVLDRAAARGVAVGFEPEPGMFIDTLDRYGMLLHRLGRPEHLRLTVDVGHLTCMGERPAAAVLEPWVDRIVNVHVDDMLACRHEHLPLGTGEVDFESIVAILAAGGYAGGLHVELPRQAHRWFETASESAAFLTRLIPTDHPA